MKRQRLLRVGLFIVLLLLFLIGFFYFFRKKPGLEKFPMKEDVFVQGVELIDGDLILSSGLYGASYVGRLENGAIAARHDLPAEYFAEGLTALDGKIYVLTWKAQKAFILSYVDGTFKDTGESRTYRTEGWGLTNDGTNLILSDGSETLRYLAPDSFATVREIRVQENGQAVQKINELEYVDGFVYANVWMEPRIIKIDPSTGEVVKSYDFSEIANDPENATSPDAVLNGIAHIEGKEFYLFGKNFASYYRVTLD